MLLKRLGLIKYIYNILIIESFTIMSKLLEYISYIRLIIIISDIITYWDNYQNIKETLKVNNYLNHLIIEDLNTIIILL